MVQEGVFAGRETAFSHEGPSASIEISKLSNNCLTFCLNLTQIHVILLSIRVRYANSQIELRTMGPLVERSQPSPMSATLLFLKIPEAFRD